MKKRIIKLIAFALLLSNITATCAYAAEGECSSWYIKRNGRGRPGFPEDASDMSKYNCYYIDDTASKNREKRIYLTFDAGYENGNIEKILDVLKEEGVPAAFFILDNIILKNENLVTRMTEEGHLVCNHTKKHKNLSFSSKEEIAEDLSALEDLYYEKTGKQMSKFFRFPEGKYSLEAIKKVCELGYTTVFWSFGYEDWDNARQMSEEKAVNKIISNTHDGEIVLLHPTSATNAKIMRTLISKWREMGYEFGTLEQLTERCEVK